MRAGLAAFTALALLLMTCAARAQTLDEALALAYQSSPILIAKRAALRAADEGVASALSGYRPTISAGTSAGFQRIENEAKGHDQTNTLTPRGASIDIVEPIYRGGRTEAETQRAENLVQAARADLWAAEQSVLLSGVTVYMDVLRDQSVVGLNQNNERVLEKQLEAASNRFQVGEVTRTDVAQAEARLAQARADRITAEGQLIASRSAFQQVFGFLPEATKWPEPAPAIPDSEARAQELAMKAHPALLAADYQERAARDDIDAAGSALLPTLQLHGAQSITYDSSTIFDRQISSSLLAELSVPLYQGGAEYSAIRRSKQIAAQRRGEFDQQRRLVADEVTRAWQALITAHAQIAALKAGVDASEIAREGVEQEAQVGLRTTLDVLDAEQAVFVAKVNLVRAQRDQLVNGYGVKSAVGELTAALLGLAVTPYDVEKNYQDTRGKWIGSKIEGEAN